MSVEKLVDPMAWWHVRQHCSFSEAWAPPVCDTGTSDSSCHSGTPGSQPHCKGCSRLSGTVLDRGAGTVAAVSRTQDCRSHSRAPLSCLFGAHNLLARLTSTDFEGRLVYDTEDVWLVGERQLTCLHGCWTIFGCNRVAGQGAGVDAVCEVAAAGQPPAHSKQ